MCACACSGPLRWLGCFCLVGLEFLASFHLHGAVDNSVGSQRLQPLHFHDHHLGSTDITVICCRPGVIHLLKEVTEQNSQEQTCCWQILPVLYKVDILETASQPQSQFTLVAGALILLITCFNDDFSRFFFCRTAHKKYSHPSYKVQLSVIETA